MTIASVITTDGDNSGQHHGADRRPTADGTTSSRHASTIDHGPSLRVASHE
jgi:hypothetical protein